MLHPITNKTDDHNILWILSVVAIISEVFRQFYSYSVFLGAIYISLYGWLSALLFLINSLER